MFHSVSSSPSSYVALTSYSHSSRLPIVTLIVAPGAAVPDRTSGPQLGSLEPLVWSVISSCSLLLTREKAASWAVAPVAIRMAAVDAAINSFDLIFIVPQKIGGMPSR